MRRFFGIKTCLWISLFALSLAGCGKAEEGGDADKGSSVKAERTAYDLGTGAWEGFEKLREPDEGWVVTDYWEESELDVSDPSMQRWAYHHRMDGTDFYLIQECGMQVSEKEWSIKYYLKHIDTKLRTEDMHELDFSGSGIAFTELREAISAGRMMLQGADVVDGKICLFLAEYDSESKTIPHACAVLLDSEERIEKTVRLEPGLKEAGMIADGMLPQIFLFDRDGNFYLSNYHQIAVLDSDGKLMRKLDNSNDESVIMNTGRLPDGRPVFERVNHTLDRTEIFCFEDGEEKVLYQGKYSYVNVRYFNEYGQVFYLDQKSLLRWDAGKGVCDQIYLDASLKSEYCEAIMEDASDESILLTFYEGEMLYQVKLRQEPDREDKEITVYMLYDDEDIVKYAAKYMQTHPGVKVTLIAGDEEDTDIALNKLAAQIQQGQGPDLIVGPLESLQSQGIAADLTQLLPRELLDNIFKGVLQENTIDGRLYGISISASPSTIAVSRNVWQGDTWTPEDVMRLMESGGEDGKGFKSFMGGESSGQLLYYLAEKDIMAGKSSLVDFEKKQCYFDSEYFIRILEFCKKHGAETNSYAGGNRIDEMRSGKRLAGVVGGAGNLRSFTMDLEALGDDFICVGYPTEGEYGGYVTVFSSIVMNAGTEHQEEALDFMEYLLGDKVQKEIGIYSVRRDVLVNNVRNAKGEDSRPYYMNGKKWIVELGRKSDGSTFLSEYIQVMDRGVPDPVNLDEMSAIISEEADYFFQGDKTAEDAAEVIQSRVSIYLNTR